MNVGLYVRTITVLLSLLPIFINSSFAQDDIEHLKRGVVKIEATTFEEKQKIGTGFIVRLERDAVYIVTASHVVEGASDSDIEVEFFTRQNKPNPASVENLEGGDPLGLALLLVDEQIPADLSVLTLSSSIPVKDGDPLTTIGFPRISGVSWAVIKGDKVGKKGKAIAFSGPVDEGNSGGPLIKEGLVIGVVIEDTEDIAYAVPTYIVQDVLESWGVPIPSGEVRLRSEPLTVLLPEEANKVFRVGPGSYWTPNAEYEYIQNAFEDRDEVVIDWTTGLMWQKSGSSKPLTYKKAKTYIEQLNRKRFAGYADWRLPTVEELMSLIEPEELSNGLYINPIFDSKQGSLWSADIRVLGDEYYDGSMWFVCFETSQVYWYAPDGDNIYVRAVRAWPAP